MIYRCTRCLDQVDDVAGCVDHNREAHGTQRLRFGDFKALGGGPDAMRQTVRPRRSRPDTDQLNLIDLIPKDA